MNLKDSFPVTVVPYSGLIAEVVLILPYPCVHVMGKLKFYMAAAPALAL